MELIVHGDGRKSDVLEEQKEEYSSVKEQRVQWARGRKESMCSESRRKATVVGAQQMRAKGVWIEVAQAGRGQIGQAL